MLSLSTLIAAIAHQPRPQSHLPITITLALVLSGCTGLRQVTLDQRHWLSWHPALENVGQQKVALDFDVKALPTGRYELSGETELPEGSQLAIAAIRYLKLGTEPESELTQQQADIVQADITQADITQADITQSNAILRRLALDPTYTILDYQKTKVTEGRWQTQLNLWQVAKNGQYQEVWQLHEEKLDVKWQPESDVIFLATLIVDGAADRLQPVQNQLADQQRILSNTLIKTSLEGEQYFQSAVLLPAQLPTGSTTPPGLRVQDINGGWGERYLLVEQDPLPGTYRHPSQRNTNAPGSPAEFIQ